MNSVEKIIFDYIPNGTTQINLVDIATALKLSRPTVNKYINKFVELGLIKKQTVNKIGGTVGDGTRQTFITKE